jgi:hypothetical protein
MAVCRDALVTVDVKESELGLSLGKSFSSFVAAVRFDKGPSAKTLVQKGFRVVAAAPACVSRLAFLPYWWTFGGKK